MARMRYMCVQCDGLTSARLWTIRIPAARRLADSPLMTLGQAKPSFKIEIVLDLLELSLATKTGQEADHQRGHVLVNRITHSARIGRSHSLNFSFRCSQLSSNSSERSRPPCRCPRRYSRILLLGLRQCSNPGRCSRQDGRVTFLRTPLFRIQVPLDRLANLISKPRP